LKKLAVGLKGYNITIQLGSFKEPGAFNGKGHLLWVGASTGEERFATAIKAMHTMLDVVRIKHVVFESPGTAHESQTSLQHARVNVAVRTAVSTQTRADDSDASFHATGENDDGCDLIRLRGCRPSELDPKKSARSRPSLTRVLSLRAAEPAITRMDARRKLLLFRDPPEKVRELRPLRLVKGGA
jgi:hypothetical protein